ncbi:MAG TPA: hypothetical protein VGT61_10145 [Thermomicrobiales bacterium]|nr:hypothetical protein [Thermomicrobiales bacterium]
MTSVRKDAVAGAMVGWVGTNGRTTEIYATSEVMSMTAAGITIEVPRTSGVRDRVRQALAAIQSYRPVESIARRPISARMPAHEVHRSPGHAVWPDGARVSWPVGEPTTRR